MNKVSTRGPGGVFLVASRMLVTWHLKLTLRKNLNLAVNQTLQGLRGLEATLKDGRKH